MSALKKIVSFSLVFFLSACSVEKMPMLNPAGEVGELEFELLVMTTLIMAAIVIPVILLTLWIAWRYRASANHSDYDPEFDNSKIITAVTIFVPLITIAILGGITWVYTHKLDPYRPVGEGRPYEIQAISLDYKWLFIYPKEGVATLNELVAPVGKPITIRITSDPMMTSIFIPGLISQIYAMPGMESRANFMVERPVEFEGSNAMYSGPGFETQRFKTHVLNQSDFDAWVASKAPYKGGKSEETLDFARYKKLTVRSTNEPIHFFSSIETNLFEKVIQAYMPEYRMKKLLSKKEYDTGVVSHSEMGGH